MRRTKTFDSDSQFDLAYGAGARLAAATLRREGYRSEDRITVFQALVHTWGTDKAAHTDVHQRPIRAAIWREYDRPHRNRDERLLTDLIRCTKKTRAGVSRKLPPPPEAKGYVRWDYARNVTRCLLERLRSARRDRRDS